MTFDRKNIETRYRFCPLCGGRFIRRQVVQDEPKRLVCTSCGFVFYIDPKIVACTIAQTDKGIVLQQRTRGPAKHLWALPGGYVDRGETLEETARREFLEETGLTSKVKALVGTYSYPGEANIVIVFSSEVTGGQIRSNDESMDIKEFDIDNIPWEQLAYETTKRALETYMKENG